MDVFFDRINPLILKSKKQNREIERALNLPKDAIYNWRNGVTKSYTRLEYIFRFAEYFNVSPDYLRGLTDDPTPKDAAPEDGAGNVAGSTAEFIQLFQQAPPEIQDYIVSLLKSEKSLREAADSAPKGKSAP